MYGSIAQDPSVSRPLLGGGVATKEQRDRRKQLRAQKEKETKRFHDEDNPVFSRVFKQSTRSEDSHHANHSNLYNILNPRSRQWQATMFKRFIALVIIVDMLLFIISTEPDFQDHWIFGASEGVASSIFLLEYIARLCVVTERRRYKKLGPFWGRLRYMVSSAALIDAFATFPFFLELLTGYPLPTLTYLRVFRLLRLTKTDQFAKSMDAVTRVLYYNRQILTVAGLVCIFLVLVTAVLLYYLRPGEHKKEFRSIPATMYMSTLMLTGQGGPDATNYPWYTKSVVLATGVFSVAMFAIPASMLTWGFEAEAERLAAKSRRRAQKRMQARLTGRAYSELSSSSAESEWSSSSIDTSDEEYQKIIAGEDDVDDSQSQSALLQELLDVFEKADSDESDSLSKEEFVNIVMGKLRQASERGIAPVESTPPPPVMARPRATGDVHARFEYLEAKVDSMDATLGRILQLLESKKGI